MPARDLGAKFVCFKCGTKFYDMKKPDPLCPKCGADQRESPVNKPGAEGRRARAVAPVPKVIEPEPEEAEVLAEEEEEIQPFDEEEPAAVEDEEI
jgi:uncharacterized protein (TIGR02300 family)